MDRLPISSEGVWPYAIGSLSILFGWLYLNSESRKLRHIPTIGYSSPILSYISAVKFIFHAKDMVDEGVARFNGGAFKVPLLDRWTVVVHGERYANDFKKASDDALSINMAINETLQVPYTIGPEIFGNPYHIPIIRGPLTRNLGNYFPDIYDEMIESLNDLLPPTKEWKDSHVSDTFLDISCRITNRMLVGLPLCRSPEYLHICKTFTIDVFKDSTVLNLFPTIFRPFVARVVNHSQRSIKKCMKHFEPVVARYVELKRKGEEMPVTMLTWLLDDVNSEEGSLALLTKRILSLNFMAIHTTTFTFIQVLYKVASYPEFLPELRQEIEDAVEKFGWSREALDNMTKLDSFIKETMRMKPLGLWQSSRMVMKDYKCLDGTYVPNGTTIALAMDPTHFNPDIHSNPDTFDGFRFANGNNGSVSRLVTMNDDHIAFGIGKHACPGRFFAVGEMKLLLAHILVTYDLKFADDKLPGSSMFVVAHVPDMNVQLMFRKRV